ncbi:vacuolar protein sorting-associated VTA1-like protein [Rhizoctonia solani]|uniref:Vacuolar protein sorting-associated VTA1-like protein n=1 Tax=Rhizoctonia solani TaxID=456999 RepID=A0A8H8T3U3_9AGAM|nr:vacuolar protein sorting-associated VTA1-like protein [Rhizoctonia solani]QRW26893.1 vacuolar protein sorting-associated VTA1-like protein [Rhizoctonia solani]
MTALLRGLSSSIEAKAGNVNTRQIDKIFARCRGTGEKIVHPEHAGITASASAFPVHPQAQPNCSLNSTLRCATEIMAVDLKLPPVPADLKHVVPFCTRAQEVRARDTIVCYWSLYYVAQLALKRTQTPENQAFLAAVVEQLEAMKRSLRNRRHITDEAAGSLYVRRFGYNVYNAAINEDAQGQANRSTAKKFLAASYFLEILKVFGQLDPQVEETIKHARSKANDIVRVLREGATPIAAAPPAGRSTPNGYTNPVVLSGRPSTFASPVESPTAATRKGFSFPQANYPPPPTDAGSGSPVSPRFAQPPPPMFVNPRRQAQAQAQAQAQERQEIARPENVALPSSGSSAQIPLPDPTSPRKLQSPVRERSPLAYVGPTVARNAQNASKPPSPPPKPPTPTIKPPSPKPISPKSASPVKATVPIIPVTSPVIQQSPQEWPASTIILTRPPGPTEWPQHALVSPSIGSSASVDSAETFTSSQLRTVIKSASTAPRASSPVKSESAASTEEETDSQVSETEDETEDDHDQDQDDDESVAESTLMPVLTVVDNLAPKLEIPGAQAIADEWGFGREMTEAIGKLTRAPAPYRTSPPSTSRASPESSSRASPVSVSCFTHIHVPRFTHIHISRVTSIFISHVTHIGISCLAVVCCDRLLNLPLRLQTCEPIPPRRFLRVIAPVVQIGRGGYDFSFSKFDRGQERELIDVEGGDDEDIGSGSSMSSFSSGSEDEVEADDAKEGSDRSDGSTSEEDSPVRASVVGGLSPEVRKQVLPPPASTRSSPSLQIVPTSAVPQPLARPPTTRSSSYDSYQPSIRSPDSPMYGPSRPPIDGEFAIIPYHPSMSASHPAPAVHNNPAYAPTANNALVRTTWTSSPTQGPSAPPHRVQVDRETASLAQKYSRFAISSLNYMDIEAAKKELRAALTLLEGGDMY